MKKYFLFDDEPINSTSYLQRIAVGSVLMSVLIGFWVLAATGYKRAGAFGWKKEYRIIAAILIPILAVGNILSKTKNYNDSPLNLFDIFALLALTFHAVMVFKNGNKIPAMQLPVQIINNPVIECFSTVQIKIKYDNYSHLDFQFIGNLIDPNEKVLNISGLNYSVVFKDEFDTYVAGKNLPSKIFKNDSKFYLKSGVFTYISSIEMPYKTFQKISKCELIATSI